MSILVHKSLHPFQIASLGQKGYVLLKKVLMSITTFPEVVHFPSSSKMVLLKKETNKMKF